MDKNHIKRRLFEEMKDKLDSREISIIVGPRQAGKTTLMKELINHVQKFGGKTLFLNLDYENDKIHLETQDALIRRIRLEFGNNIGYVFIDEIQRKKNAGLFLKGIYDMDLPYRMIVSGSGSLELKESIHESLAGRKRMFELHTVDFYEFVDWKTEYKYSNRLSEFFATEKDKVKGFLEEYINYGGYPRVILALTTIEKSATINEIYRSVVERDIMGLLNIDRPEAFSTMIKIIASQNGQLLKYSELAKQIGVSVSVVKKYIWYAEKTFLIRIVSPYSNNKQKEILKSPILYFCDIGLRNFSVGAFGSTSTSTSAGFVFQNLIGNDIYGVVLPPRSIHFWRTNTGAEVDFVIAGSDSVVPIEVKYSDMYDVIITRSLRSFIEKYHPKIAIVVNKSFYGTANISGTLVTVAPFHMIRDLVER